MSRHARGLRGRTDGRRATAGRGRHGRQAASADRLRAGIEGSDGGGQAKIAMSRQGRGLRGLTDGRAGTGNPVAERRDGLFSFIIEGFWTFVSTFLRRLCRFVRATLQRIGK